MADARTCPDCGSELPARAPEGLCPRCLLGAGLASEALSVGRAGEVGATMTLGSGGVLETISATLGAVPRVLLRDTDLGIEPPLVLPGREAGDDSTRYRIDGEIARGGMGAVLKGRDPDLGRDVAIKVLRDDLLQDPDMVRRFVEEAQIGGQLQHPGIVPIYELGAFADRRPFFSMKLVKGHTLAGLLGARKDPASDLPRFINIVEAVAQTVAYAHARGVIHRDLKPSNVMVGSFGEVQVMDWGLAKVLPRGGVVDDASAGKPDRDETVIATARSGSDDSDLSHAGSVLGTPSYMAPEQARGEIDGVDERADVFALGSILCEVLTGQPAFTGRGSGEIQRKAALGDTADALARLGACGADPELIALAKDCLAREPEDRPREAGAVSGRVTAYVAGVQERLRRTELARAAEAARAEEAGRTAEAAEARAKAERRARRLQLGLAATLLAATTLGGLGTTRWLQQRSARLARVDLALKEAELLSDQAEADAEGDVAKWEAARAALRRAADLRAETSDATAAVRVAALGRRIDGGEERARRDRRLIERVEAVRFRREPQPGVAGVAGARASAQAEADYAPLFREAGLDPDRLDPTELGRLLASRPAGVSAAAVAALDDWAMARKGAVRGAANPAAVRLFAAARASDPDPWRNGLREALASGDRAALARLAGDPGLMEKPPASLVLLTEALTATGQTAPAIDALRRAQRRYPDNFPIAQSLGWTLWESHKPAEALPFATAAVALAPRSGMTRAILGIALAETGRFEAAEFEFREAIRLQPDYPNIHSHYGYALFQASRLEEAAVSLREAVRLKPDWGGARRFLGVILLQLRRSSEAEVELRKAVELCRAAIRADRGENKVDFNLDNALYNLGLALLDLGKFDEATAAWLDWAEERRKQFGPADPRTAAAMRTAALSVRLPALLKGDDLPRDAAERVALTRMCRHMRRHAAAARFFGEAFAADPKLAADLDASYRYDAACEAALAGAGAGKDEPMPDEAARAKLRRQALDWLVSDLAARSARSASVVGAGQHLAAGLRHWKADPDLAGVRDPAALAKLPEAERKDWQALWADVDALLKKAEGAKP